MKENSIIRNLEEKALDLRRKTFNAFVQKGEAHLGGSFSIIEILVSLYSKILKNNDKFILSKAHASFPLCILLKENGLNPNLTTHLEIDPKNGIFCTTGSLGHGLPIGLGMALAKKKLNQKGKIFVMISDGECQEGTTWESLLIGAKHKLSNLIILVDYNKIQALDRLEDALPLDNLKSKFNAFNWDCYEVEDGHSFSQIISSLEHATMSKNPTIIMFNTIKGKGIKPFEGDPAWHARKIKGDVLEIGKKELGIK